MADTTALAGLRRLVLHSRDLLEAYEPDAPDHLRGQPVTEVIELHRDQYAAHALAVQVLTLVADCLPDGDS